VTRSRTLLILTLLTITLTVVLWMLSPPHPEQSRLGYTTSAFALQMVRDWPSLTIVLATPARAGYRLHTLVDFLFIALYGALWIGMTWRFAAGRRLRWIVAGLFALGMLCDVLENFAILRVLAIDRGFTNEMARAIRNWALDKWLLLGWGWFGLAIALLKHRLWPLATGYVFAFGIVVTAWLTEPAMLQLVAPALLVTLLAQSVYFARQRTTNL